MTSFQLKVLIACELVVLCVMLSACGDGGPKEPGAPFLEVTCDAPVGKPRCYVEAHYADSVEAFYGDKPAWYDRGITEWRVVYVDSPPKGSFVVDACNDIGCTVVETLIPEDLR